MKLHHKVAISIVMALSLVSCVGHQDQENLSTKSPVITKNNNLNAFTMAMLTSGQIKGVQDGENVVDLIKRNKNVFGGMVLSFACNNGNSYYNIVDFGASDLISNNINTNDQLASFLQKQISFNKNWTGQVTVNNNNIGFMIYWINNPNPYDRVSCWMTSFPEDKDIAYLLSFTQQQGATKL